MSEPNAFETVHAPRYRSLDMLRGAASIGVMVLHLLWQRGVRLWNLAAAVAIILVAYAFSVVFERPFTSADSKLALGVAPEARVHKDVGFSAPG